MRIRNSGIWRIFAANKKMMDKTKSEDKKVSVVILNWNGKSLLEKFLPVALANTPDDMAEIVVADNASSDDSLDFLRANYPDVRLIVMPENYGFAEGYNRVMDYVSAPYIVLLNSDVEVSPGWLDEPVSILDTEPDVAAVQPRILSYNDRSRFEYAGAAGGWIDCYGYPFCRGRVLDCVEEDKGQYSEATDIFWASGACCIMRRSSFVEAGGFDKTFFAHQEEIDLCWRLRSRGQRFRYAPTSTVYHIGAATLRVESPRKTFLNFRNNLLMIYKNLPDRRLRYVMWCRFLLDNLALVHFLLTGKFANAKAVFRARMAFHKLKTSYRETRRKNIAMTVVDPIPEMLQRNMLLSYYLKGQKTFTQLISV